MKGRVRSDGMWNSGVVIYKEYSLYFGRIAAAKEACSCSDFISRFLARDSMLSALYAIARPYVRPSVARVDQSKTV